MEIDQSPTWSFRSFSLLPSFPGGKNGLLRVLVAITWGLGHPDRSDPEGKPGIPPAGTRAIEPGNSSAQESRGICSQAQLSRGVCLARGILSSEGPLFHEGSPAGNWGMEEPLQSPSPKGGNSLTSTLAEFIILGAQPEVAQEDKGYPLGCLHAMTEGPKPRKGCANRVTLWQDGWQAKLINR